ncbi:MAG: hypothetical protein HC927_00885 [Deltaproteobacteria bacterium]|nr:hypothetical protein [Deltaproteobacteria bacterium]
MAAALLVGGVDANASPPPPPSAQGVPVPNYRVAFVIETGVLSPEVGERLEAEIAAKLTKALADDGFPIASAPKRAQATVTVKFVSFDEQLSDYEVLLGISSRQGDEVVERVRCTACSEARVVERISEVVPKVIEKVDERRPRINQAPERDEPEPEPIKRPRIGAMGISGAVLVAGAGVALGFGAERMQRGVEIQNDPPSLITTYDYRPAGGTLLGIGAAALITGSILLIFDGKNRWPRRDTNYAVILDLEYAGIQITHHF